MPRLDVPAEAFFYNWKDLETPVEKWMIFENTSQKFGESHD
jgi:hypothetical protein